MQVRKRKKYTSLSHLQIIFIPQIHSEIKSMSIEIDSNLKLADTLSKRQKELEKLLDQANENRKEILRLLDSDRESAKSSAKPNS
jgi:hypothetical protein